MEKYNALLTLIKTSLQNLEKSIKGEILISQEFDEISESLLKYKVPSQWKIYESLKPLGTWYQDLTKRVDFIWKWKIEGFPLVFPFSAFVFPQGFLTAIIQSHARKTHKAIDTLTLAFEVTSNVNPTQVKEQPKVRLKL